MKDRTLKNQKKHINKTLKQFRLAKTMIQLSIIGTVELFYTTKGVAGALYTYFESFTIAMIIYFIMTFTCSRILRVLEHKMDGPDNYDLATADTLTHTSGMYSYRERKDDRE